MKKKTALLAVALGSCALALSACGSSGGSAPATDGSSAISDVSATAPSTVAPQTPEQATTESDPLKSEPSKKQTVTVGDEVTLKAQGKAPKNGGIAVTNSNGMSFESIDASPTDGTATFVAKKSGEARVAIGFSGADGQFLDNWTVYEITIK